MSERSEQFRILHALFQPDIARMMDEYEARIAGHDDVRVDGTQRTATFQRGGAPLWHAHAEPLGRMNPAYKMFRWWWHGRTPGQSMRPNQLDAIVAEARRFGVGELTHDQLAVESEDEAYALCQLAARLAKADGVLKVHDDKGSLFVALFDLANAEIAAHAEHAGVVVPPPASEPPRIYDGVRTYSFPAVPVVLAPSPVRMHSGTLRGLRAPPSAMPVREPVRDVLQPVLQTALGVASGALQDSFVELLLMILVDPVGSEVRYFVNAVALTTSMRMAALDVPVELSQAVERMIEDDVASGNGRWSTLTARLRRTPRGAAVEIQVKE